MPVENDAVRVLVATKETPFFTGNVIDFGGLVNFTAAGSAKLSQSR